MTTSRVLSTAAVPLARALERGRRGARWRTSVLLVSDVAIALAVTVAAHAVASESRDLWNGLDLVALVLAVLTAPAVAIAGGYDRRAAASLGSFRSAGRLFMAGACCAWGAWLVGAIAGSEVDPRRLGAVSVILPLGWLGLRRVLDVWTARRRPERVLLIGRGHVALHVVTLALRHPERGLHLVGRLDDDPRGAEEDGLPLLGGLGDLPEVLGSSGADRVIVAFTPRGDEEVLHILRACDAAGVTVDVVPRLFELVGPAPIVGSLGGLTLLGIRPRRASLAQRAAKRGIDIAASAVLLVLAAPLLAVLALAIRIEDRGPAFFRQERVGRGGRRFRIVKLRTMAVQPPAAGGADVIGLPVAGASMEALVQQIKRDGAFHTTRLGQFLRRTSLDELPQLWNVLLGQMSLVGPRPLQAYEDAALTGWHQLRREVRPGITGLWQILGRSEVRWEERMRLDYTYVRHWSIGSDLRILLGTLPAVIRGRGAG